MPSVRIEIRSVSPSEALLPLQNQQEREGYIELSRLQFIGRASLSNFDCVSTFPHLTLARLPFWQNKHSIPPPLWNYVARMFSLMFRFKQSIAGGISGNMVAATPLHNF